MSREKIFRDGVRYGLRVAYLTVVRDFPNEKEILSYIKAHHDEIAETDAELKLNRIPGMRSAVLKYKKFRDKKAK